ncbi:hypothetical protein BC831DRAFT_456568 [Entophlyctis helioformis]|nr:hypothetical protein BC831DRAFT_456568 [Entophlyctis helioformis]
MLRSMHSLWKFYRLIAETKWMKPEHIPMLLVGSMVDTVTSDVSLGGVRRGNKRPREVPTAMGQQFADILRIPFAETTGRAPQSISFCFRTLLVEAQRKASLLVSSSSIVEHASHFRSEHSKMVKGSGAGGATGSDAKDGSHDRNSSFSSAADKDASGSAPTSPQILSPSSSNDPNTSTGTNGASAGSSSSSGSRFSFASKLTFRGSVERVKDAVDRMSDKRKQAHARKVSASNISVTSATAPSSSGPTSAPTSVSEHTPTLAIITNPAVSGDMGPAAAAIAGASHQRVQRLDKSARAGNLYNYAAPTGPLSSTITQAASFSQDQLADPAKATRPALVRSTSADCILPNQSMQSSSSSFLSSPSVLAEQSYITYDDPNDTMNRSRTLLLSPRPDDSLPPAASGSIRNRRDLAFRMWRQRQHQQKGGQQQPFLQHDRHRVMDAQLPHSGSANSVLGIDIDHLLAAPNHASHRRGNSLGSIHTSSSGGRDTREQSRASGGELGGSGAWLEPGMAGAGKNPKRQSVAITSNGDHIQLPPRNISLMSQVMPLYSTFNDGSMSTSDAHAHAHQHPHPHQQAHQSLKTADAQERARSQSRPRSQSANAAARESTAADSADGPAHEYESAVPVSNDATVPPATGLYPPQISTNKSHLSLARRQIQHLLDELEMFEFGDDGEHDGDDHHRERHCESHDGQAANNNSSSNDAGRSRTNTDESRLGNTLSIQRRNPTQTPSHSRNPSRPTHSRDNSATLPIVPAISLRRPSASADLRNVNMTDTITSAEQQQQYSRRKPSVGSMISETGEAGRLQQPPVGLAATEPVALSGPSMDAPDAQRSTSSQQARRGFRPLHPPSGRGLDLLPLEPVPDASDATASSKPQLLPKIQIQSHTMLLAEFLRSLDEEHPDFVSKTLGGSAPHAYR